MTESTPHPIHAAAAPHYTWGGACDGWRLVESPDLSVIQERMPPGTSEVRHRHRRARQFFYVLRGRLAVECANLSHVVGPDAGLEIPPLAAHRVFNDSGEVVEFLVVSQPPSQGDREPVDEEAPT